MRALPARLWDRAAAAIERTGGVLDRIERWVGWGVSRIGQIASFIIFVMIASLSYAVFMRYVLNAPAIWPGELSSMLYAVYFLLGGSYALLKGQHVRVDVVYSRLPERGKALADVLTASVFFLYVGVVFWLSIDFARSSIMRSETSSTLWAPYIWPVKLFLPIATFLMLLVGLIEFLQRFRTLVRGR
jgi:TRAP-type mannitol/chloroaromatic compound transport system permease small subunit